MNDRPDANADENIRKHLSEGGGHLIAGVGQPLFLCQRRRVDVHRAGIPDEILHLRFHVPPLDDAAAEHRHDQAQNHIRGSDLAAENAHEQNQAAKIHHRRRNQERKGHTQRQACAGEADKQRNGRAGAKRRHSPQQRRDAVGPQSGKSAHNLFAALRRKIALNIGNQENQEAQQNRDLNDVVQKELHAAAPAGRHIQPQRAEHALNQYIQPFHGENLILNKLSDHRQSQPPLSPLQQERLSINALKACSVSQFRE